MDAINLRASDLHFEPYEYHYRVRFRVDGELREIAAPPVAIKDKLSSRIKVISRLDIAEKRVPQDGRMKLKFGRQGDRFPGQHAADAVRRKDRDPDPGPVSSAKLGIEALGYERIEKDAADEGDPAAVRHGAGHRPDGQRQDGFALHLPEHPQPAGRQHLHRRGPGGNQPAGRQPGQRQRQGRASPSRRR